MEKRIDSHRVMAKRLAAVVTEARRLAEEGNKVGHIYKLLRDAQLVLDRRIRAMEPAEAPRTGQ